MAKGKFRINTRELQAGIRRLIESNRAKAKAAMTDAGHFIRSEAQLRTPVDEGMLTSDVHTEVVEYRKSYAATVYIPVNCPSAKYAVRMHEGTYKLGANSQSKQGKVPVVVGRKYITRAIDENREEIGRVIAARMKL